MHEHSVQVMGDWRSTVRHSLEARTRTRKRWSTDCTHKHIITGRYYVPTCGNHLLGKAMNLFVGRVILLETILATKVVVQPQLATFGTGKVGFNLVCASRRRAFAGNHHCCHNEGIEGIFLCPTHCKALWFIIAIVANIVPLSLTRKRSETKRKRSYASDSGRRRQRGDKNR